MSTRIDRAQPQLPAVAPQPKAAPPAPQPSAPAARVTQDGFEQQPLREYFRPPKISPEQQQAVDDRVAKLLKSRTEKGTTGGVIDVHFHVIRKGEGAKNGDVPQEQLEKQIDVLNAAYKGTGWEFKLSSVDRTTNAKWYTAAPDSRGEAEMKTKLRVGESDDLNIYLTQPGEGVLGWATFPSEYQDKPEMDGVVLLNSSLPGGAAAPFNEGDTATHEVGHWMGLWHTWNQDKGDGKGETGDEVDDTPVHAEPNFGKPPETTDTSPKEPGFDPVHNYMNYVDDDWMHEFTKGQDARMDAHWQLFREVKKDDGSGAKPE